MTIKIAINGFGRIGRVIFRALALDTNFEVVAINDPGTVDMLAHLLKYDSVHGRFNGTIEKAEDGLIINGRYIRFFSDRNPANLPWGELGAELVIEATGHFTDADKARIHIESGAKRILICAPAKNEDITIVMGVNSDDYDPEKHFIVSNASCTTNCLAPFVKVLCDSFGVKQGFMNTIHSYTNDQKILDHAHPDYRRARSAAVSIIPTSTGAAKALGLVIPQLKGKLDGMSMRVPTPDGSVVDLVAELERPVTKEEINAAMKAASEGELKGILEYCTDPIVSVDVIGNPSSSIFDAGQTMVMGGEGTFVKCISWYDNEWGYSCRVADLAKLMMS